MSSRKKIRTRAVFKTTCTNYISIERLWNVEFEKNNVLFGYSFHNATEAGKRQNDWLTFRRIYWVWNAIAEAKWLSSVNHKVSVSAFSCIFIGYLLMELSSSSIELVPKRDASEAATRKIFKIREFIDIPLFLSHQCKFWPNFTEIRQFYIPNKFL